MKSNMQGKETNEMHKAKNINLFTSYKAALFSANIANRETNMRSLLKIMGKKKTEYRIRMIQIR
jgi:hypothetical protein